MKNIVRYISLSLLSAVLLAGCCIHEWPEPPAKVDFRLVTEFNTDMTVYNHPYEGRSVEIETKGKLESGIMRYTIRAYPLNISSIYSEEFVFTFDLGETDYNQEFDLALVPGEYNLMVWADLTADGKTYHYDVSDFGGIRLQGDPHPANTNYRDAFRGTKQITLISDIYDRLPETYIVEMRRPLAKFEFLTNDVQEFLEKEATRLQSRADSNGTMPDTRLAVEDYNVKFFYVGFMPFEYSMHTDRPVDSSTNVIFESKMSRLSESEATLGFDYVFTQPDGNDIDLQIGIYDEDGMQLSLTDVIRVPLWRDVHTVVRGSFLMSDASGGVTINPEYDGDHNLYFP